MATCASCQQPLTDGTKFCNNCGAPVGGPSYAGTAPQSPASAPMSPPTPPPTGLNYTKFCASCGKGLVAAAVICPNCGAAQAGFNSSGGKSKTTAVLMAVFLTAWTWVYTWKVNKKKFLIALGLWVLEIILFSIGASEAASKFVCTPGGACSFQSGSSGLIIFAWLIGLGIWIWAIVDTSTKSQAYYASI
jgi:RNA polymerase subunit RPABC4/transcription elongation factor Spt4